MTAPAPRFPGMTEELLDRRARQLADAADDGTGDLELGPSIATLEAWAQAGLELNLERRRPAAPWADLAWSAAGGLILAAGIIAGLVLAGH